MGAGQIHRAFTAGKVTLLKGWRC